MTENVILVNEQDQPLGLMEKMEAHRKGLLHRAFSVFVFNENGEMLLQQRALHKYHSGGLWTNTCCSHPRKDETNLEAAHRRLMEEMGFDCELEKVLDFVYKAELDKGLTEHEFDHVFIGRFDGVPKLNLEEAESYNWAKPEDVRTDILEYPGKYTEWFKIIFDRFMKSVNQPK